ncbi:hypothetical protein N9W86_03045, partial [Amylibacter sp.]|nr:hypothetical protein [Amylibacter sp.]
KDTSCTEFDKALSACRHLSQFFNPYIFISYNFIFSKHTSILLKVLIEKTFLDLTSLQKQ